MHFGGIFSRKIDIFSTEYRNKLAVIRDYRVRSMSVAACMTRCGIRPNMDENIEVKAQ